MTGTKSIQRIDGRQLLLGYLAKFQAFPSQQAPHREPLTPEGDAGEAFSRPCTHTEAGPWTLCDLVLNGALHLEDHVKQLQEVRVAYRESRAKQAVG